MISGDGLRLVEHGDGWALAGTAVARFDLVNEYLGYLADRNYSPKTVAPTATTCSRSAVGWTVRTSTWRG